MGNISVRGLKFYAFHGCYPEEKKTGGRFEVDISVTTDFSISTQTDDVTNAINYVQLMEIASSQMQVRRNLIETVAEAIGNEIKSAFPEAGRIEVCVRKMTAPVLYDHDYVSATIVIE